MTIMAAANPPTTPTALAQLAKDRDAVTEKDHAYAVEAYQADTKGLRDDTIKFAIGLIAALWAVRAGIPNAGTVMRWAFVATVAAPTLLYIARLMRIAHYYRVAKDPENLSRDWTSTIWGRIGTFTWYCAPVAMLVAVALFVWTLWAP